MDPDTAYRSYSPDQLADARLIEALRRAGMPLAEVALVPDCAGRTDSGLVREENQDAIVTGERLVAVADGLGGHAGGMLASRLATGLLAARERPARHSLRRTTARTPPRRRRSGFRSCAVVYSAAMTTSQDRIPGPEDDEEEPGAGGPRRRRLLLGGLAGVLAVAAVVVPAVRLAATPAAAPPAAASPTSAVASAAPTPQEGQIVIRATLTDVPSEGGLAFNPLVVGTQPLEGGAAPDRVPNFDTCTTTPTALQYLPVQIRMPENWLSGTFTVQTTAGTPAGIGRLGFFFQAGADSTPCPNGTWSPSDSFLASNTGQQVITGYVVLERAFTAASPQGRPDVFRSLQLRVSNLRYGNRLPIVGAPTVGSLCPGTRRDLCAPLG